MQAGRYFSRLHKYNSVRQLLSCVKDSGLCTDAGFDDVVSACVRVIADDPAQVRPVDIRGTYRPYEGLNLANQRSQK